MKPSAALPTFCVLIFAANVSAQPFQRSTLHTGQPNGIVLATGDFNKDVRSDLAIAHDQVIEVRLANAQGDFPTRDILVFDVHMPVYDMRAADLDQDGVLELVVAGGNPDGGAIYVLKPGPVPGVYSPAAGSPYFTAASVFRLVIADFNLDGKLDIAAQTGTPAIHILLQTQGGAFAFAPGTPRPFAGYPSGIAAGDFNGDGKPDLVYTNQLAYNVLLGNGDGSFSAPPDGVYTATPRLDMSTFGVVVADFDKDGKMDFAGGSTFDVFWGDGAGSFQRGNGSGSVLVGEWVGAADFTGDGKLDFWGVSSQGTARVLVGDGNRRFDTFLDGNISLNGDPAFAALGDFDGDGRPDFAVLQALDDEVWIYRNLRARPSVQTITFVPIPNKRFGDVFLLSATASSGLPVTFRIVSGPATVQGNTLTVTGFGSVTVEAAQTGSANFDPAIARQTFSVTSEIFITQVIHAASLMPGPIAPGSLVAIKGAKFPERPTVVFRNAPGQDIGALVTYSSAEQINIVVPPELLIGAATVTVLGLGSSNAFPVQISSLAPGVFMVDPAQSIPAGQVLTPKGKTIEYSPVANCAGTPVTCTLVPLDLGSTGPSLLTLYGTGFRAATALSQVAVSADSTPLRVVYVGGQGSFDGLDQLNVELPYSLAGRGVVTIWLSVQGLPANPVKIQVR